jgi:uncharacterized membrane protein
VTAMLRNAGRLISRVFLRGLVVILPITLTVVLVIWLAMATEALIGDLIRGVLPGWPYWPGLGIALGVLIVFAAGIMVHDPVTRWLLEHADALLERIPLVKSVYLAIRDIAAYISQDSRKGFRQVVVVRIQDMRLIGFVTVENPEGIPADSEDVTMVGVYLPMSYGIGGYTVYLPKTRIEPIDMSLEDAMRLALIGGVSKEKPKVVVEEAIAGKISK